MNRPKRLSPVRHAPWIFLLAILQPTASLRAADDAVDQATRKAIGYLLQKQDSRGAIRETDARETAMTALSVLAMLAVGHQPRDPTPEGEALLKAIRFLLSEGRQDSEGYFGKSDRSGMYGHGITTLVLAECLGMGTDAELDERVRESCQRAVDLILRSQKVGKIEAYAGGWRYTPTSADSDLSVTVWQTMALRASKNAGLSVPADAISEAVAYIKRLFKPPGDTRSRESAGFGYTSPRPSWSTSTAGFLALQVCGDYTCPEVVATGDYLLTSPPRKQLPWFYYGAYYYAQGMYQRGGEHAEEAARNIREILLPLQQSDGAWGSVGGSENNVGPVYRTTLAVLSLSVKYHYLPIYQR
jgi:hypothetical protein